MRIPSSIFGLIAQLTGCNGCSGCESYNAKETPRTKVLPVPDQKISVCTQYHFEEPEERCRRMGNTDMESCHTVMIPKSDAICSDPQNSLEAAQRALDLKLLECGKSLRAFREEENARTIKFCADIDWERKGRFVTTGGNGIPEKTEPLIHREGEEICGEGSSLEVAGLRWEASAIEFVQGRLHYRYSNTALQKVAEETVKAESERLRALSDSKAWRFL